MMKNILNRIQKLQAEHDTFAFGIDRYHFEEGVVLSVNVGHSEEGDITNFSFYSFYSAKENEAIYKKLFNFIRQEL